MSNDSNIKYLARLVTKQAFMIGMALSAIADQACLLEQTLEKCSDCHTEIVTVEHRFTHVKVCDRCAAERITNALHAILEDKNPDFDLDHQLFTVVNENNWVDVVDADKIRRMIQYTKIAKELDVEESELH